MTPYVQPPILGRYCDTRRQHPDGLYDGPPYPGDDDTLRFLEAAGTIGHSSGRRGDYRYVLRHPEEVDTP